MRILLIYHFFYPDTVISARLFSELAEDLVKAGHQVTVFTGNRLMRSEGSLAEREIWKGVEICRYRRPDFRQGSHVGRMLNSLYLQHSWLEGFKARKKDFDAVILGTDPQFGYLMFPKLRKLAPKCWLIHWCFDMYPEGVEATGGAPMRVAGKMFRPMVRRCYGKVDVMVDIGECMRQKLNVYHHAAQCVTVTPWALAEPKDVVVPDMDTRRKLFGDAKLCFLYSGTVGRAHDITPFIELARECRRERLPVGFCFAGYGNCYLKQTAQLSSDDTNITLAGFASEEELEARLASADFHLISLRQGWEGIVVPSKFFGALAIGRPVLFAGPEKSEINGWINKYGLGYHLTDGFMDVMRKMLEHPEQLAAMKSRAFAVYQERFSRRAAMNTWVKLFKEYQNSESVK